MYAGDVWTAVHDWRLIMYSNNLIYQVLIQWGVVQCSYGVILICTSGRGELCTKCKMCSQQWLMYPSRQWCYPISTHIPSLLFCAWSLRLLFIFFICNCMRVIISDYSRNILSLSLSITPAAIKCNQHDLCVQEGQVFSMLVKWAHSVARLLSVYALVWGEVKCTHV